LSQSNYPIDSTNVFIQIYKNLSLINKGKINKIRAMRLIWSLTYERTWVEVEFFGFEKDILIIDFDRRLSLLLGVEGQFYYIGKPTLLVGSNRYWMLNYADSEENKRINWEVRAEISSSPLKIFNPQSRCLSSPIGETKKSSFINTQRLVEELEKFRKLLKVIGNTPAVSIFGSARLDYPHPFFISTLVLASNLSQLGYKIITGGGRGLMEAANRGAAANRASFGLNIQLENEQKTNSWVDAALMYKYFFARKIGFVNLSRCPEVLAL